MRVRACRFRRVWSFGSLSASCRRLHKMHLVAPKSKIAASAAALHSRPSCPHLGRQIDNRQFGRNSTKCISRYFAKIVAGRLENLCMHVPCEAGPHPQQGTISGPSRTSEGPSGSPCQRSSSGELPRTTLCGLWLGGEVSAESSSTS